ncbi:unnamed protein product [Blepharisma stoltei]|uniref:RAP domain-containing protein n=1 Tax=Blepharisma stoltei TaxID=1481888 RepID=A0AAU9JL27_9CILI|nr:unnamed protein product [Blepharisma stoltei]
MVKGLAKLVQSLKKAKDVSQTLEILDQTPNGMLHEGPSLGIEMIKLAATKYSKNDEIFQVLESPKFFNAFRGDNFWLYLNHLLQNKKSQMNTDFYLSLEKKINKMTSDELTWRGIGNAWKIFAKYSMIPSFQCITKLEEEIIDRKKEFDLATYGIIMNAYANLRILENPEHKNPQRFMKEMITKKKIDEGELKKQSTMVSLLGIAKSLCLMHYFSDTSLWLSYFKNIADAYSSVKDEATPWKADIDMSLLHLIDAHQTYAAENMQEYQEMLSPIKEKCIYDPTKLAKTNKLSDWEKSIEGILKKFSLKYEADKIVSDYYTVDYFFEPNIAIEIYGPIHFLRKITGESTNLLKGKSIYKSQLLGAKGLKIIRVPYHLKEDTENYIVKELQILGILSNL